MKKVFLGLVLFFLLAATGVSVAWRILSREEPFEFDPAAIRLEVINGCAFPRLGRAVADELEARGFCVYGVSNAAESIRHTVIVDLLDPNGGYAHKVARALSVRKRFLFLPLQERLWPETTVRIDSTRFLEVQVVAGQDFRKFFPKLVMFR